MLYREIFSLVLLIGIVNSTVLGSAEKTTYELIRERIAIKQAYTIDDEIELALPIGKSVRFDVTDNGYGLKTYFVYPRSDDRVVICYLDTDENIIYRVLLECCALLRDGHTEVWGPGTRSIRGLCRLPIELRPLAGKRAVIVAIYPTEKLESAALRKKLEEANLKLHEEVTHIDGRPVRQILEEEIYPWICASTDHVRDLEAFPHLVRGSYNPMVTLRIKGMDGEEREVSLVCGNFPIKKKRRARGFVCRELEEGLLYVNLPSFGSDQIVEDFEAIFPRVRKAKGLILDVRYNGGGDTGNGYAIIGKLTKEKIEGSRWKTRKYLPAYRAWGRNEQWHEGQHSPIRPTKVDPYLGPIVVLTGPNTVSAAEDFVVALHASKRAIIVGERTAGTTGQPLRIELPGDGGARICTKRDTYPDGREFVGVGVIPDVEVHPTRDSLVSAEDLVLQKGIEVLRARR